MVLYPRYPDPPFEWDLFGDSIQRHDLPFRFLDLPAELRNRIYSEIFVAENYRRGKGTWSICPPSPFTFDDEFDIGFGTANNRMLAILQTCPQIHNEAHNIPYSQNCIHFSDPEEMVQVLGFMNNDQLAAITRVEVHLPFYINRETSWCYGTLKLLTNLTYLRLIDASFRSDGYENNDFTSLASKMKELRGLTDLEIVVESRDVEQPDSIGQRIEAARKLTEYCKPYVTQPKAAPR